MTINIPRSVAIGVAAVLVVVIAAYVVIHRHGHVDTVNAAPLSATDRQVLLENRSLVESLPAALAEVPVAASNASDGRVSVAQARALLERMRALSVLSRAVAHPASVTQPLTAAYDAVVAGHSPGSLDELTAAVQQLQTVEGQIDPAIRLIAARGGTPPSAATTWTTLAVDQRVTALAHVVTNWQQVYGALVLVEQSAAG
jgi:hypothetical protein